MKQKLTGSISGIEEEPLADFNPPPRAQLARAPETDEAVNKDKDLDATQIAQDYYNQYAAAYQASKSSTPAYQTDDQGLISKLNYVIHLLEEQQDQKTNSVVEEIILYAFLGVFIIFIIDSFARAGKYVR